MESRHRTPDPARRRRPLARAGLTAAVLVVAAVGATACAVGGGVGGHDGSSESRRNPDVGGDGGRAAEDTGAASGALPAGGISLEERSDPALARLDPRLRAALEAAAGAASDDGTTIRLTSGWRSASYQSLLFQQAIREHGNEAEARRWVASPSDSAHVRGEAVDIGPTDAASWMEQHGSDWGLCRRFANEMWHYELSVDPGGTCPAPLADASVA